MPIELPIVSRRTFCMTQHITSLQHKTHIRNTEFNKHILDLTKRFHHQDPKELSLPLTDTGSGDRSDDSVEIIGSTGRKIIKTNTELPLQPNPYSYAPQVQSYALPGNLNPYVMPGSNTYNPFSMMNNCHQFSYLNGLAHSSYNPYLQQAMMCYPWFCMPYQSGPTIDIFQPQG